MRVLSGVLALLVSAPVHAAFAQSDSGVKQIGVSAGVHFVVVAVRLARSDDELRRVAHTLCAGERVCAVRFWINEAHAARQLPMTDEQGRFEIASFSVNRNTGQDDFTCRPTSDRTPPCVPVI
ncbi:MAG TPA: hypothetical protein VNW46_05350 [Gemmatimonadaceae bacterium]|jgi:hypothetical protein|nr:hypothetical protein [Gemmatimonadaceae bacterium]